MVVAIEFEIISAFLYHNKVESFGQLSRNKIGIPPNRTNSKTAIT